LHPVSDFHALNPPMSVPRNPTAMWPDIRIRQLLNPSALMMALHRIEPSSQSPFFR